MLKSNRDIGSLTDTHTGHSKARGKKKQKVYFYILFLIYDSHLKRGYKQTPPLLVDRKNKGHLPEQMFVILGKNYHIL